MLTWLRSLTRVERLTVVACFLGWALDAMDNQSANMLIPTLGKVFGVDKAQIGVMATATLFASGIGGWLAGAASDRFGRVIILQMTILWFSLGSVFCGLADTFPQLVAARIFQGIGFGGEWAVGAVLIAEITRPQYRAMAVGVVQSGYSVGIAAAAGLYFATYSLLPEEMAWRAVFFAGVLPALLVVFIRRSIKEPADLTVARMANAASSPGGSLTRIFTSEHLRATIMGSLLCLTLQGASAAISVWLPTLLKTTHGLSIALLSAFFILQSIGAFLGYLLAAIVADKIGRRASLAGFTLGAMVTTGLLCFAPITASLALALALPLGFFALGLYSNFGPVLSELYPASVRGSGQGFCYNVGRGLGAVFPAIVGFGATTLTLPTTIGVVALGAYTLACGMILILPETRGKIIDGGVEPGETSPPAHVEGVMQH